MNKSILVISHQRAGTHLTIDLLQQNFDLMLPYISYKDMTLRQSKKNYLDKLFNRLKKTPRVYKSHSHSDFHNFYNCKKISTHFEETIKNTSTIYIYRDPKDVLTSLFYHLRSYNQTNATSLGDFIIEESDECSLHRKKQNRLQYLYSHVTNWIEISKENNILAISYEEILSKYEETVGKIAMHLGEKRPANIKDVRNEARKNIKSTAVNYRRGIIGDHVNHMSQELIKLVDRYHEQKKFNNASS